MLENNITSKIIHYSHIIHASLGGGLLEKCYEGALCVELTRNNFSFERQKPLPVYYRGELVGDYYCDLCVESLVIIELKACSCITKKHQAQLLHYMRVAKVKVGLIINFADDGVQVKRMVM